MKSVKNKIIYQFFSFVFLLSIASFFSQGVQAATGTFGETPYGGGIGSADGSHGIVNNSSSRGISGTTTATGLVCPTSLGTVTDFVNSLTCFAGKALVPLVFAVALLVFVYGVVKYVIAAHDSNDREEGRMFMIYGIVALFVMVSVWGLVAVLANTFNVGSSFPPRFQ